MKILLDECLPKKLKHEFTSHEIKTVPEMGWAGKKNGELLKLMTNVFEVFVTSDQNLSYQQRLDDFTYSNHRFMRREQSFKRFTNTSARSYTGTRTSRKRRFY